MNSRTGGDTPAKTPANTRNAKPASAPPAPEARFDDPHPSVRPTRRWLSILIALLLVTVVGLWMGSGQVGKEPESLPETDRAEQALAPTRVRVDQPRYEVINQVIEVTGKTAPNRAVRLRAAASGTVRELNTEEGELVEADATLIRLDAAERNSRLAEARALERQEELNFFSVEDLTRRGLASRLELTQAKARLQSTRASVKAAREALSDTRVTAPFAGLITSQNIELGDYVSPGAQMLELAEITPTLVTASLSERDLAALGDAEPKAEIELATGERLHGRLRYIAPGADSATNTFPVEITLLTDQRVRLGVTAEVRLTLAPVRALRLSPDQLELNARGELVIKYVDAADQVQQTQVDLVRTSDTAIWVKTQALPADARIITIGGGFTKVGEVVEPVNALARVDR